MDIGYSTAPARPVARESRHTAIDVDWEALGSWAAPASAGWIVIGPSERPDRSAA